MRTNLIQSKFISRALWRKYAQCVGLDCFTAWGIRDRQIWANRQPWRQLLSLVPSQFLQLIRLKARLSVKML